MAILEGVLKEEIGRLENNISHYEEMLSNLPRGSIFVIKVGNSSFAYRKRKENGKVISEYLGNINDKKAQEEIERSNDYKRIKNNIRIAKEELRKLRRAIKAYDWKWKWIKEDIVSS